MPQQKHQDDLTRIKGIGPIIEKRLIKAGINSLEILANQSPKHLLELVPRFQARQQVIQEWILEAKRLTSAPKKTTERVRLVPSNRQRYATFTLEILLDKSDRVRRTRVVHIQSGEENHWASWDESRLSGYIVQKAQIKLPSPSKIKTGQINIKPFTPPVVTEFTHFTTATQENPQPPANDLQFFSISVTKIELHPKHASIPTQCEFELTGSKALEIAARHTRFVIEILAFNLFTSQVDVMAISEGLLQPDQLHYSISLAFPPPKVGRYQLETIAFLPEEDAATIQLGPILMMIP